ncbi:MAG: hypothetical protein Q8S33_03940 [Myxococcales bacterium]|nr:hypothetical protein [Myxococcales bacterium]
MISALLMLVVSQPMPMPGAGGGDKALAPTAIETARLYFIAGNIPSAREWGQRGLKKEAKLCKPLLKNLAEYSFLLSKYEALTLDEAKLMIVLDRRISPKAVGKLTTPVIERYVTGPMVRARLWAEQGAAGDAVKFIDDVLTVDPSNADAKALRAQLLAVADGGVVWDAGR